MDFRSLVERLIFSIFSGDCLGIDFPKYLGEFSELDSTLDDILCPVEHLIFSTTVAESDTACSFI